MKRDTLKMLTALLLESLVYFLNLRCPIGWTMKFRRGAAVDRIARARGMGRWYCMTRVH
jgi:hypothetical protein